MTSTPATVFPVGRANFKPGFVFGAGSAAFQVEGAFKEGGRGPSIWDTFCFNKGLEVGNAIDEYHRYMEDIALMEWMGLDAYRFSISWSRIFPNGKKCGGVNAIGVQYYHDLIDELLANGLEPYVTLFHWDVPQALEDKYGSFLSDNIIEDFKDFADVCFMEYGKKVKFWTTLNEPMTFSTGGYATGLNAPGRGEYSAGQYGHPESEPYIVTHNLLRAHAEIVNLYRRKYQHHQNGKIGLTLNAVWVEPLNPDSKDDKDARDRYLDFTFNWFLDPVLKGSYPEEVKTILKQRKLPDFTAEQSKLIRHSFDFLGLNYYMATYVRNMSKIPNGKPSYITDSRAEVPYEVILGEKWEGSVSWLTVYPKGLSDCVCYIDKKFKDACYVRPIYITENGYGETSVEGLLPHQVLHDEKRVLYHRLHLSYLLEAINRHGLDVRGYFIWSLMDNFEWNSGFTDRFGTIFIDYKDGLKRYPKFSANWFKVFLDNANIQPSKVPTDKQYLERSDDRGTAADDDAKSPEKSTLLPDITNNQIDQLKIINGSIEQGDLIEAKKSIGSDVNADPVLGPVDDTINSNKI